MRALFSRHFFRAPCFFAILLFPQAFSFYLSDERRPVSEDDRFRGDDRHARSPYVLPLLSGRAAPVIPDGGRSGAEKLSCLYDRSGDHTAALAVLPPETVFPQKAGSVPDLFRPLIFAFRRHHSDGAGALCKAFRPEDQSRHSLQHLSRHGADGSGCRPRTLQRL